MSRVWYLKIFLKNNRFTDSMKIQRDEGQYSPPPLSSFTTVETFEALDGILPHDAVLSTVGALGKVVGDCGHSVVIIQDV